MGADIGIEIHGGNAVVLIKTGSRAPVAHAMTFTTVADGQRAVEIRLVRGGDPPGVVVGRFLLSGLRAAPRGEARVDVGLSLDPRGVLHAWAFDRSTGARQEAFFPGLWAIEAAQRGRAVSGLARRVGFDLELMGPSLRDEAAAVLARAVEPSDEADRATALATIAGEVRVLRRSVHDN
ncbi:MAG TPA: Hsp70 family protein [Spirochaetia bacterium]